MYDLFKVCALRNNNIVSEELLTFSWRYDGGKCRFTDDVKLAVLAVTLHLFYIFILNKLFPWQTFNTKRM